jgi:hypothetical protein
MKQCPHCGTEISDSASICDLCVERTAESAILSAEYPSPDDPSASDYSSSHDSPSDCASEPTASGDYSFGSAPATGYASETETSQDATTIPGAEPPVPTNLAAAAAGVTASSGRDTKQRDRKLMAVGVGVVGVSVALGLLIASSGTPTDPDAGTGTPTQVTSSPARKIAQTPPVANQVTATFKSKWNSTNRDWVGNQRKAVAFELSSENKVAVWQRQVQLTLVVRCVANRVDAFVFTQSPAKLEPQDNDHTVRLAFDGQPESVERWPDSDEHDALFAPDGAAFVQRLTSVKAMRFGFTPHNSSPVSTVFNVAGLAEAMAPAARQCGMKK